MLVDKFTKIFLESHYQDVRKGLEQSVSGENWTAIELGLIDFEPLVCTTELRKKEKDFLEKAHFQLEYLKQKDSILIFFIVYFNIWRPFPVSDAKIP